MPLNVERLSGKLYNDFAILVYRIFNVVIERAVQYAWLDELGTVNDARRSKYPWTSAEINQLKHNGRVTGYTHQLRRPVTEFPELADDPTNILFIKQ